MKFMGGAIDGRGHEPPVIWAKSPDPHYMARKPRFEPPIFFHGAPCDEII